MLAQTISCAGVSVQLINPVQDPAKYIHFVIILTASQKYLWDSKHWCTVFASSVLSAPSSHIGHIV